MRVLVTDGSSQASLAIIRSLGRAGHWVSVISPSADSFARHSRYCKRNYTLPFADVDSFAEQLIDLLGKTSYDIVIPQGYGSTVALARHRARIGALAKFVVADEDKIRSAADKRFVYQLGGRLGLCVPPAFYPTSLDELKDLACEIRYPVVIKPRFEAPNTVHPRYVRHRNELFGAYLDFCKQKGSCESNVLMQEFVPGYVCGFFALFQEGECKRVFMHRRIREWPPTGKISACAESYYDAKLRDYGIRLLDGLQWHGVAMVEFRYDVRDKDYKLLEINPRFWGSLDLALAAGVDFPNDLCRIAAGRSLNYSDRYPTRLRYHWPFYEMRHLWKRPSSWMDILKDSLNSHVQSNLWLRDIAPNLSQAFTIARSMARKWMRVTHSSAAPIGRRVHRPG